MPGYPQLDLLLVHMPASTPPALPSTHQALGLTDGQSLFSLWSSRMAGSGRFNTSTVETYGSIWNAWLGWLASRGVGWAEVTAQLIQVYLDGPSPGLVHHRPALRADRMANFTRQRYWRVLRAVYAEGVRSGLLVSNPMLDVPEGLRPVIDMGSRQSQVLPVSLLAYLRDAAVMERCLPAKHVSDWWVVRDRAAVLLLSHLGVTTRELMALRGHHVFWGSAVSGSGGEGVNVDGGMVAPAPCPAPLPVGGLPVALGVAKGDDDMFPRTLDVPRELALVLQAWWSVRREVLANRLARRLKGWSGSPVNEGAGGDEAARSLLDEVCLSEPLFMSRQRSPEQLEADAAGGPVSSVAALGLLPPMEASNVYSIVRRTLDAVYGLPALAGQHPKLRGLNQASGAAIIRNTVLLDWVNTVGDETAAGWAGLRSVVYLRVFAPV